MSEEEKKSSIKENIENLKANLNSTLSLVDNPSNLMIDDDVLPEMDMGQVELFDYEKEMECIKINAKDTLNCLANLYLNEEIMRNKNINSMIRDDSLKLAELNYSIFVSKRALNSLMNQIDFGNNNPEMYKTVFEAQREMRETIKAAHDLLNVKMKKFYMELKEELTHNEIDTGKELEENDNQLNIIGDPKGLDKLIEDRMKETMKNKNKDE
jgi:hypothetical protein